MRLHCCERLPTTAVPPPIVRVSHVYLPTYLSRGGICNINASFSFLRFISRLSARSTLRAEHPPKMSASYVGYAGRLFGVQTPPKVARIATCTPTQPAHILSGWYSMYLSISFETCVFSTGEGFVASPLSHSGEDCWWWRWLGQWRCG